jgi:hypothetical protein
MWLLIHLLIALQDIHVSVQQHHSVHVVRRTLGHHHLRRRRTAAYKITLHFLERVRTDRTSTGTANTYYYYYCVVSLRLSPLRNSHGWRGPTQTTVVIVRTHYTHVPETFPQSYFEPRPALDHCGPQSFLVFLAAWHDISGSGIRAMQRL